MTKLKLDKFGREVLSSVPVEVFVGDIKVDPLQRVKIDILRSFISKLGDHGSLESEEDFDDFDIDEFSDDMNFGLTEYEYFATLVKNYDKKLRFQMVLSILLNLIIILLLWRIIRLIKKKNI